MQVRPSLKYLRNTNVHQAAERRKTTSTHRVYTVSTYLLTPLQGLSACKVPTFKDKPLTEVCERERLSAKYPIYIRALSTYCVRYEYLRSMATGPTPVDNRK